MSNLKNSLKNSINNSLNSEDISLEQRFNKADELFSSNKDSSSNKNSSSNTDSTSNINKRTSKDKIKTIQKTFTLYPEDLESLNHIIKRAGYMGYRLNMSEIIRVTANLFASQSDKAFAEFCSHAKTIGKK